jgi:hypothetical protein
MALDVGDERVPSVSRGRLAATHGSAAPGALRGSVASPQGRAGDHCQAPAVCSFSRLCTVQMRAHS